MKVLIIGAGWYGCHLATILLAKGINITIVDKSNTFFSGSSIKNQNRLHLGFHYPRSNKTIIECKKGYSKFIDTYGQLVNPIPSNLYFISASDSIIDIVSYMDTMNAYENSVRKYQNRLPLPIQNIVYPVLEVDEYYINPHKARNHFIKHLQPYMKALENYDTIENIVRGCNDSYDLIINCTYNMLNPIDYAHYELFVTLLYKIETPTIFAYTIMDGPFFSIYPYDLENKIYTVTSVVHGVVYKGTKPEYSYTEDTIKGIINATESQIRNYIPSWNTVATYVSYYTSWKTKHDTTTDDRSVRYSQVNNVLSIYGGKITGIFEAEQIVLSAIAEQFKLPTEI